MFVEAFLGALLALVVVAAARWTITGPFFLWRMRRAGAQAEPLAGLDFAAMREQHKREVDEQNERERKLLAAEIVREMKAAQG